MCEVMSERDGKWGWLWGGYICPHTHTPSSGSFVLVICPASAPPTRHHEVLTSSPAPTHPATIHQARLTWSSAATGCWLAWWPLQPRARTWSHGPQRSSVSSPGRCTWPPPSSWCVSHAAMWLRAQVVGFGVCHGAHELALGVPGRRQVHQVVIGESWPHRVIAS